MQLKRLHRDSEAVSPAVGVVLMVALTIVLTGSVGVLVTGFQVTSETTPSAQITLEADSDSDSITAVHESGETFDDGNTAELLVRGNGDVQEQRIADSPTAKGCRGVLDRVSPGQTRRWKRATRCG